MNNTLLIGKLIYATIHGDQTLATYIGERIYPIVAPADTLFPFVVFTRSNAYASACSKDAWIEDKASFQITVLSQTYDEGATIANGIRDLFENCIISNNDLRLSNIRMTSCSEAYGDDTFSQTLYFECNAD